MKLSNELIKQAKQCKSAEEIEALAKKNNIELAEGEAKEIFRVLNAKGELADEELNNVAGGKEYNGTCSGDTPLFSVGDELTYIRVGFATGDVTLGKIVKISDKREGIICKEFLYTLQNLNDGKMDEIYETALASANPWLFRKK